MCVCPCTCHHRCDNGVWCRNPFYAVTSCKLCPAYDALPCCSWVNMLTLASPYITRHCIRTHRCIQTHTPLTYTPNKQHTHQTNTTHTARTHHTNDTHTAHTTTYTTHSPVHHYSAALAAVHHGVSRCIAVHRGASLCITVHHCASLCVTVHQAVPQYLTCLALL